MRSTIMPVIVPTTKLIDMTSSAVEGSLAIRRKAASPIVATNTEISAPKLA